MTHKEAIEELKKIDTLSLPDGYLGKMDEALKMAIEALQTEPCEDCISRQAVLDILDRHTLSRMALYEIEDLPSVQPFINKPCVSEQACHEDKIKVLGKLKADLHATAEMHEDGDYYLRDEWIDEYFDQYMAESEDEE